MADTAVSPIVDADLPCVGCGYNLRGLAESGVCPECGMAIERSPAGDRLRAANPAWLRRIVRGQRLLSGGFAIASLAFMAFFCIAIGGGFFATLISTPAPFETIMFVLGACVMLIVLGATVGATVGAFLVTDLEPRETLQKTQASPRAISRSAMVSVCILAAARVSMMGIAVPNAVLYCLNLALVGALTVATVMLLIHLAELARRAPDRQLADRTRKFARTWVWLLPGTIIVAMLFPLLATNASLAALPLPLRTLASVLGCFFAVLPFVFLWHFAKFTQLLANHRELLIRAVREAALRLSIRDVSGRGD